MSYFGTFENNFCLLVSGTTSSTQMQDQMYLVMLVNKTVAFNCHTVFDG